LLFFESKESTEKRKPQTNIKLVCGISFRKHGLSLNL
jgi:hypothetical protein